MILVPNFVTDTIPGIIWLPTPRVYQSLSRDIDWMRFLYTVTGPWCQLCAHKSQGYGAAQQRAYSYGLARNQSLIILTLQIAVLYMQGWL